MNIRKYHVHIDGLRHQRDGVSICYTSNDYIDQFCDFKLFCKEYVGEHLFNLFTCYTGMKNIYPFQVIDLRFQVDHITPQKLQLHGKYRGATDIVILLGRLG